jgi:hypothetical protein
MPYGNGEVTKLAPVFRPPSSAASQDRAPFYRELNILSLQYASHELHL